MRSLRILEKELLRQLGARLTVHGFSGSPQRQAFCKASDDGRIGIHLSFIEHQYDIDVTADLAIRFDSVEELINRHSRLRSGNEKAETFTLGAEPGNLERREPFRWTIAESSDVPDVADRIYWQLRSTGLPFFERFSRLEEAYEMLSRDDQEAWVHSPVHAERAKRACALLLVMGREQEIAGLAARKREFLRSGNHAGLAQFDRFVTELTS